MSESQNDQRMIFIVAKIEKQQAAKQPSQPLSCQEEEDMEKANI